MTIASLPHELPPPADRSRGCIGATARSCDMGGRFIVLEGLSGVGKSTVAPLLADTIGADCVDTLLPELELSRRVMDVQRSVEARMHFWMAANYSVSDVVRDRLAAGRDVVIESYFYRTLATHAAMGARELPAVDWERAVVPHLVIELTVDEHVRRERLGRRTRGPAGRHWAGLTERGTATVKAVYSSFGLVRLDTTGLTPDEVVGRIQQQHLTQPASVVRHAR